MKHKKELMLSMLQELIKENDLFFQLFSKHGEQKLPFFSFIFILLFLKIQFHLPHFQLFFFQFCLLFILFWQHFNCWLSARPSNFPFSSCRNKLPKKEKKCCIYLYKRATKASSPYLPPGVGKGYKITLAWRVNIINVAENCHWATTLKLWIYWAP